jgi:hypothetical protein
MADHEKLTEKMNDIFNRILLAADDLNRWNVPAAKREKIISLARKLRETAYQAGRTESTADVKRKDKPSPNAQMFVAGINPPVARSLSVPP